MFWRFERYILKTSPLEERETLWEGIALIALVCEEHWYVKSIGM